MAHSGPQLTDSQILAHDLSRNIAVAAGAGTGKTRVLTSRYLWTLENQLANEGRMRPDAIIALTFTDKAAAEMRGRIQRELFSRSDDSRWAGALKSLERSPICTIHAFCMLLLRKYAVEAGLDPAFGVLDSLRRWRLVAETVETLLAELAGQTTLEAGREFQRDVPGLETPLKQAVARLAVDLNRNQLAQILTKLLEQRLRASRWLNEVEGHSAETLVEHWRTLIDEANRRSKEELQGWRVAATYLRDSLVGGGLPPGDRLAQFVEDSSTLLRWLLQEDGDEQTPLARRDFAFLLVAKGDRARSFGRAGAKKNWKNREEDLEQTRQAVSVIAKLAEKLVVMGEMDEEAATVSTALARLGREALNRYQLNKSELGVVDFDDFLELALNLLQTRPDILERIRQSFDWLLLDEVQDVSATQWEILRLLAGEDGLDDASVFAVGDDKQSIYRFRGAEVGVFAHIRQMVSGSNRHALARQCVVPKGNLDGDAEVEDTEGTHDGLITLAENFRSSAEVIDFCNVLFQKLFSEDVDGEGPRPGPLLCRRPLENERVAPGVDLLLSEEQGESSLGGHPPKDGDDNGGIAQDVWGELREEAVDVARYLATGQWCSEKDTGALPWQDCAILLRTRTHLQAYEEALRRFGIPFVTLGGVGFYRAQEVQDVICLLRFLADPRDDLALATVLRSPLGNLSDRTLLRVRQQGRPMLWQALGQLSEELAKFGGHAYGLRAAEADDVVFAYRNLTELVGLAGRISVADLLEMAVTQTGAYAAWAVGSKGSLALANVAKLIDMARAQRGEGADGLFDLAESLHRMVSANRIEGEAEIAEAGQAVRILTIHAAKGLEFPLVIVPGLGAKTRSTDSTLVMDALDTGERGGSMQVGLKVRDPDNAYLRSDSAIRTQLVKRGKQREAAEAKRLFYVACTRARDRLVLTGTYRKRKDGGHSLGGGWLMWLVEALELKAELDNEATATIERDGRAVDGRQLLTRFRRVGGDALHHAVPVGATQAVAVNSVNGWDDE
jgi:ATP-dependent helicase/nuclease subunit A